MKGLNRDQIDRVLAGMRPGDEKERRMKREASDRVAVGDEARREDTTLEGKLREVKQARNNALDRISRYDVAIDEAVAILGPEHQASKLLLTVKRT